MFAKCIRKNSMNSKQLLKFYFYADGLNGALDNLIMKNACNTSDYRRGGEYYADRICELIGAKQRLCELWGYLDGVIGEFSESEREVLRFYGVMRGGTGRLSEGSRREIKRVTVKFMRHARAIGRYAEGVKLVKKYYCLINLRGKDTEISY